MNTCEEVQDTSFPSIVFKIKDGYYAVNSKNVATIMQVPEYDILPDAPKSVAGIFPFRGNVIPLISIRSLFGMQTIREEAAEFTALLEQRKQDHIEWVRELNRSVREKTKFVLAKDPHKCAFGRWYDHYETKNHTIKFHLKKMEEPHRLLHEAASHIEECLKEPDPEKRERLVKDNLSLVEDSYMPKITSILDDAKELFSAASQAMLIVIDQGSRCFALAVDEVLSVEELADAGDQKTVQDLHGSRYLSEIKTSPKTSHFILMLDDYRIAEIADSFQLS